MKKFVIIAVVLFVLANIVGYLTEPDQKKLPRRPVPEAGMSTPPRTPAAPEN
ncbi:MAG: hypothetical protein ACREV3_03265 [Gammaproteobacteria bacterium]